MIKKYIFVLIALIFCILPSVIFSNERIVDPYYYITLSAVEISGQNGHISSVELGSFSYDPLKQGHIGYETIILMLSKMTGISSRDIACLPIGGVLVPLLFFILIRRLFRSSVIAALAALVIAFDPSLAPGHYSVFAYAWERALLFIYILLIVKILNNRSANDLLSLIIVFVGTFSIYWTTPALMVVLTLCLFLMDAIQIKVGFKPIANINVSLILALSLVYLGLSKVLYEDFLPAVFTARYGAISVFDQLKSWFNTQSELTDSYVINASGDQIYSGLLVARYIVLLTPVVVYLGAKTLSIIRRRTGLALDRMSYIMYMLIFASLFQTMAYAMRAHLSFRYLYLFLLPITLISLKRMKFKLNHLFMLVILVLVIGGFTFLCTSDFYGLNRTRGMNEGAQFLLSSPSTVTVLTDFNTFGTYLYESTHYAATISFTFYTPQIYASIINQNSSGNMVVNQFDIIVINNVLAKFPIAAPGWTKFEPIIKYIDTINSKSDLDKIYDDSKSYFYKI